MFELLSGLSRGTPTDAPSSNHGRFSPLAEALLSVDLTVTIGETLSVGPGGVDIVFLLFRVD